MEPQFRKKLGKVCVYDRGMTNHSHIAAMQQAGQGSSMAIGEFGGAPAVPGGVLASTPLYWLYELTHAALNPAIEGVSLVERKVVAGVGAQQDDHFFQGALRFVFQ